MSGHTEMQTGWEETNEEVEQRHRLAQSEDSGWLGTIVGLALALVTLVALTLAR